MTLPAFYTVEQCIQCGYRRDWIWEHGCPGQCGRTAGENVEDGPSEVESLRIQISALYSKIYAQNKRITDLGYYNLDALIEVFQRNVRWLEERHPARLYRAGLCPKCGSDNTALLNNGDGECQPCGHTYPYSNQFFPDP